MYEKEVRFRIDDAKIEEVRTKTALSVEARTVTDIVFGSHGFDTLDIAGFICRVRKQGADAVLQCKRRIQMGFFEECSINIPTTAIGIHFLQCLSLSPYLVIARTREIRTWDSLRITLDTVKLLGQFVEIEVDTVVNEEQKAECYFEKFIKEFQVSGPREGLYGDLIRNAILRDTQNREAHDELLRNTLQLFLGQ